MQKPEFSDVERSDSSRSDSESPDGEPASRGRSDLTTSDDNLVKKEASAKGDLEMVGSDKTTASRGAPMQKPEFSGFESSGHSRSDCRSPVRGLAPRVSFDLTISSGSSTYQDIPEGNLTKEQASKKGDLEIAQDNIQEISQLEYEDRDLLEKMQSTFQDRFTLQNEITNLEQSVDSPKNQKNQIQVAQHEKDHLDACFTDIDKQSEEQVPLAEAENKLIEPGKRDDSVLDDKQLDKAHNLGGLTQKNDQNICTSHVDPLVADHPALILRTIHLTNLYVSDPSLGIGRPKENLIPPVLLIKNYELRTVQYFSPFNMTTVNVEIDCLGADDNILASRNDWILTNFARNCLLLNVRSGNVVVLPVLPDFGHLSPNLRMVSLTTGTFFGVPEDYDYTVYVMDGADENFAFLWKHISGENDWTLRRFPTFCSGAQSLCLHNGSVWWVDNTGIIYSANEQSQALEVYQPNTSSRFLCTRFSLVFNSREMYLIEADGPRNCFLLLLYGVGHDQMTSVYHIGGKSFFLADGHEGLVVENAGDGGNIIYSGLSIHDCHQFNVCCPKLAQTLKQCPSGPCKCTGAWIILEDKPS